MNQAWNAELYQDKHAFVWELGVSLLEILHPQAGERVLDLGCGTGQLTAQIAEAGASVVGIDLDSEMIRQAKANFPHLEFEQANATKFHFQEPFDAVFSNAALHWVLDAEAAVRSIAAALKPGGRFVAEFGGKGNVQQILEATSYALVSLGYGNRLRNPWYFPSIGAYSSLLERHGLSVGSAQLFDRPTPLEEPDGLRNWFQMFHSMVFRELPKDIQPRFFELAEERARENLWKEDHWMADYVRLRIVAEKPIL